MRVCDKRISFRISFFIFFFGGEGREIASIFIFLIFSEIIFKRLRLVPGDQKIFLLSFFCVSKMDCTSRIKNNSLLMCNAVQNYIFSGSDTIIDFFFLGGGRFVNWEFDQINKNSSIVIDIFYFFLKQNNSEIL